MLSRSRGRPELLYILLVRIVFKYTCAVVKSCGGARSGVVDMWLTGIDLSLIPVQSLKAYIRCAPLVLVRSSEIDQFGESGQNHIRRMMAFGFGLVHGF